MKYIQILLVLIGLCAAGYFYVHKPLNSDQQTEQKFEKYVSDGLTFSYPSEYRAVTSSSAEKNEAKILVQMEAKSPGRTLTIASEKGVTVGAAAAKSNTLDYLDSNAEKVFPKIYSQYSFSQKEHRDVSGRSSSLFSFSYIGSDEKTRIFVAYTIIPIANDAMYVTIQSETETSAHSDIQKILDTMSL